MGEMFKRGAVALALFSVAAMPADAKHLHPTHCASSTEVTAIAATSIQQELMVAALTCNQVPNFNAFQTSFGPELRASDRSLLRMFQRLYGARGSAEYHGFKTRLANDSEIRSIHGNSDFCTAASLVFSAALASNKPSLSDFVSGVQVEDPSPVNSCQMEVALGLQGAMSAQQITPRQKPSEFRDVAQAPAVPALASQTSAPVLPVASTQAASAAQMPSATPPASTLASTAPQAAEPQTGEQPKKKSGWFSGMFN